MWYTNFLIRLTHAVIQLGLLSHEIIATALAGHHHVRILSAKRSVADKTKRRTRALSLERR